MTSIDGYGDEHADQYETQTVRISVSFLKQLIEVCESAVENTEECLNQLTVDADIKVKKHRVLADTYRRELEEAEAVLKKLYTINGW